ncbi:MAG: SLATT domain-containing protein [Acidimicrobiia bacterium]|nr:SLATT domain-containing protein [Acidimicrobiia bacterium]
MARRKHVTTADDAARTLDALRWSTADERATSVQSLYSFSTSMADTWIAWYSGATRPNKRYARRLRGLAIVFVSIAGLIPVLSQIQQDGSWTIEPAWASVALGLAVALIALDKFFGFSASWARYTLARFELEKRRNRFLIEWQRLLNEVHGREPLDAEGAKVLIAAVGVFVADMDAIIQKETVGWVAEFQSALEAIEVSTESNGS